LAAKILADYKTDIEGFTLVPAAGGKFELSVDGELIFSKLQEGHFPEYDEVKPRIEAKI